MKWFTPDWSWLLSARRSREKRKPVRPQFELLEDRWLFNANPLVPRPLNPLEGVPASNNDWLTSLYSTGAVSPMVPGTFANFGFGGNYTLQGEGTYDLEIHIYGSDFSGSFSFDATGSVAYDLLQQGGNANGLYGVSTFSLDQSATVSFHYHDSGTLLDPPRDISATPTVDVHDPGDFTFLPDNRHWHIFNWYSIVGDIDDIYDLGMFDRNWGTLTVTESGTHSHTLTDPTSTSFTYSGTNLINSSITGDNLSETLNEYRSGNMTFTEHGEGTFTLSEAGSKSGLPNLSFSYSESGATTYSLVQATTETHTATAYGSSLSNSIRSADSVGGMTTTLSWDYEATLDSTHRQSGTTTYVLNEEGGYGSGLAFSLLYRHQEGNGTFSFEQTGSRSDNRSHSIRTHADGRDNLGSAFNSTDSFAADSSDSYTDSGTVQTAYSQSGSVSFTLEQTGDNPIGLYQFSVISYTQNSNSTFTFSETTDFTRGGAATLTLRQDSTDSTTIVTTEEAGYGSLGSYNQQGSDSYAYASSETSAYSGPTDSTITQEGTLSSTLHQAGSMTMTSPYASTSFVLDQQGTSSFTRDEHSYPEQSGLGTITRTNGGLGSFSTRGEASYTYGPMLGSGFASTGSFGHSGNDQGFSTQVLRSTYAFSGPGTLTLHQQASTSFTQHETGVPNPSAFRIDQDSTGSYNNHQDQTRTLSSGLATVINLSGSTDTAGFHSGGVSSFTGTGRSRRDGGNGSGAGLHEFSASDTTTANLGGNSSSFRNEKGSTSFTLHLDGTRLSGTLSLSSYTLRHGSDGTFTSTETTHLSYSNGSGAAARIESRSGTDGGIGSFGASGSGLFGYSATESYGLGGNDSAQSSGFRSFQVEVNSAYSFSGGETVVQSHTGQTSLTLYQAGGYSQGSYSLGSYAFRQGSDGTFVLHHETTRSTTGTETSVYLEQSNGTFNGDGTGLSATQGTNTPVGYAGTMSSNVQGGTSNGGEDDRTFTARWVEAVSFEDQTDFTRTDRGSESFTVLRVGTYSQSSFSYGLLRTEQGSDGTYVLSEVTEHTWEGIADGVSDGTFIQNSIRSTDGSSTNTVAGTGFDRFGATTFTNGGNNQSTGSSTGLTNSFSNGTFHKTHDGLDSAWRDATGTLVQHAFREGSYAGGTVNLSCLTLDRSDRGTFSNGMLRSQSEDGWQRQSTQAGGAVTSAGGGTDSFVFGSNVYQSVSGSFSQFNTGAQTESSTGLNTVSTGGGWSFSYAGVSSYAFSSTQTVSHAETGRQTFSLHEEGTSSGGNVNLSSFVLSQQSSSLFTNTEDRTQYVYNGFESFTRTESRLGLQTLSQGGSGSQDGSQGFRLNATTTYTSNNSAGSNYSATGDAGVTGTSNFNITNATTSADKIASSSGHDGSTGSMSSTGNGCYQFASTGSTTFSSDSSFRFDQSGQSSYSLYAAGSYPSGNLGMSSYAHRDGSTSTYTQHQESHRYTSSQGTDLGQQISTGSGTSGSAGSMNATDAGTWAFAVGTMASSGSGSGSGLGSSTQFSQSTFNYLRGSAETVTTDQRGGNTVMLLHAGTYGNGAFSLSCVVYDTRSTSTFTLQQDSHSSEDGTFQVWQTAGSLGSVGQSGSGSGAAPIQESFGGGTSRSGTSDQSSSGSGSDTGQSNSLSSLSYRQVRTADGSLQRSGENNATEHQAGQYIGGSLSLESLSRTQDGNSRFTFTQTVYTEISNGSSLSSYAQSGTSTAGSGATVVASSTSTGTSAGMNQGGSDSLTYSGSYSFSQGGVSSHSFSGRDTVTLHRYGQDSYTLAQVGVYAQGSIGLTSFTLRQGSLETYDSVQSSGRQVSNGSAVDSSTSSGQGTQGAQGSSVYNFSSSGVTGATGQSLGSQSGVGTLSRSGVQTSSFSGPSVQTVSVTGGQSSTLYQRGQFSSNSFTLDSYTLDRHQDSVTTVQRFANPTRSGTAVNSVTWLRSSGNGDADTANYQGSNTANQGYAGNNLATWTQLGTYNFTSPQTVTRQDWSTHSATDHRSGSFSSGRLSLSCYALTQKGEDSFTLNTQANGTFSGAINRTDASSGSDSFNYNSAGGSYTFGTSGVFSQSTPDSYSFSGTDTSGYTQGSQSSFVLTQLGSQGNASWSLGCISYKEGSNSSFASSDESSRSLSGTGVSGTEYSLSISDGAETMTLSQTGSYGGASLSLDNHEFQDDTSWDDYEYEAGSVSFNASSQDYEHESGSLDSTHQYEQGHFDNGRFYLQYYKWEQRGNSSYTLDDSGTESTTVDQGVFSSHQQGNDSYTSTRDGGYQSGQFNLECLDEASGASNYNQTAQGQHSAGSFAGSYREDASGEASYAVDQHGQFANQSLNLDSYGTSSMESSSYGLQRTLYAAVPDAIRKENRTHKLGAESWGSGDFGTSSFTDDSTWVSRGEGAGLGGFASAFDRSTQTKVEQNATQPLPKQIDLVPLNNSLPPVKNNAADPSANLPAPTASLMGLQGEVLWLVEGTKLLARTQAWQVHRILAEPAALREGREVSGGPLDAQAARVGGVYLLVGPDSVASGARAGAKAAKSSHESVSTGGSGLTDYFPAALGRMSAPEGASTSSPEVSGATVVGAENAVFDARIVTLAGNANQDSTASEGSEGGSAGLEAWGISRYFPSAMSEAFDAEGQAGTSGSPRPKFQLLSYPTPGDKSGLVVDQLPVGAGQEKAQGDQGKAKEKPWQYKLAEDWNADTAAFDRLFEDAIKRGNPLQLLMESPEFIKGVGIGFVYDGLWGNIHGLWELGKMALSGQQYMMSLPGRWLRGDKFEMEKSWGKAAEQFAVQAVAMGESLRQGGWGLLEGLLRDDPAAKSKVDQGLATAALLSRRLLLALGKQLVHMKAEDAGRIYGMVLYEVAEALLTAGAAKAIKAGHLAKLATKLKGVKGLRLGGEVAEALNDLALTLIKIFGKADEGVDAAKVLGKGEKVAEAAEDAAKAGKAVAPGGGNSLLLHGSADGGQLPYLSIGRQLSSVEMNRYISEFLTTHFPHGKPRVLLDLVSDRASLAVVQDGEKVLWKLNLPYKAPDWVAAEELFHLVQKTKRFGVDGARASLDFQVSANRALRKLKEGPEALLAWARESPANRLDVRNAVLSRLDELEAKNWVLKQSGLKRTYSAEEWLKIESEMQRSLRGYEEQRKVLQGILNTLEKAGP